MFELFSSSYLSCLSYLLPFITPTLTISSITTSISFPRCSISNILCPASPPLLLSLRPICVHLTSLTFTLPMKISAIFISSSSSAVLKLSSRQRHCLKTRHHSRSHCLLTPCCSCAPSQFASDTCLHSFHENDNLFSLLLFTVYYSEWFTFSI